MFNLWRIKKGLSENDVTLTPRSTTLGIRQYKWICIITTPFLWCIIASAIHCVIISFFSVIIEDSLAEERERAILGKTKEDEEREKEELERLKVQQKALYHHWLYGENCSCFRVLKKEFHLSVESWVTAPWFLFNLCKSVESFYFSFKSCIFSRRQTYYNHTA